MNGSILEVVIIGAGHAGLSASYYLKHLGLEHAIFERGRIGEVWRSQRWDSFTMNTSNRLNALPGSSRKIQHPESFGRAAEHINILEDYASVFQLPISQNANVLAVDKPDGSPFFVVTVAHENEDIRKYNCWQVIIATGCSNEKVIPAFSASVSAGITQLHSSEYKNASKLPEGAVLVVGSAQSGSQIAGDLIDAGRKVYLSTSAVPRMPRRYRGKDIMDWLIDCKFMDTRITEIQDQGPVLRDDLLPRGVEVGTTISLQYLALKGVELLGRAEGVAGGNMTFAPNTADHLTYGDAISDRLKAMIDEFIQKNQLQIASEEIEDIDLSLGSICTDSPTSVDFGANNIRTIVWATGFRGRYDYIKLPVLDDFGIPKHQQGVTSVEGLYFLGCEWMRSRKSNFIFGIKDDAGFITNKVYSALR